MTEPLEIRAVDEYNTGGHLIFAENFPSAFVRGETRELALPKFAVEVDQYLCWLDCCTEDKPDSTPPKVLIVQEKFSTVQVCDADTDILFDSERFPLSPAEYNHLKWLALKSARDFQLLYDSIPNKSDTVLPPRSTFYGAIPRTAEEMYLHTRNVNSYYFGEIGIPISDEPDIVSCRMEGFDRLESLPGFLDNPIHTGSFSEQWTLRKVCRRFIWHDRIHVKAMYRMAIRLCGKRAVANPFYF